MDLTNLSLLRNPGAALRPAAGVVTLRQEGDADVPPLLGGDDARLDPLAPLPAQPVTSGEQLLALLAALDGWLAPYGDRPPGGAFVRWRQHALEPHEKLDEQVFDGGRQLLGSDLASRCADAPDVDWAVVARLTRLALLLELLDPAATPDAAITVHGDDPNVVFDLLRRRTPLLPAGAGAGALAEPRVQLIRGAKVSDLFVVRSEWSCYLPGEIAAITNVLAHEELARTTTLTNEEEQTTTQETQHLDSTEKTDEDRSQSEISREVDRAQELQVHAEANVNVSGSYGMIKFAAAAGVGVNASLSESSRQASKISRDVLSKAVSRVENRVREERVRRTLTRSVDRTRHAILNETDEHVRGVYRWVDRIDRYQIFRYPDRLHLEFEIPEPAEYLRYRLGRPKPAPPGGVKQPPAFTLTAGMVTRASYATSAARYHASGVPTPPDDTFSVSVAASLAATGDEKIDGTAQQWAAPLLEKLIDVVIPIGYGATEVAFAATAMPKRAPWHVERPFDNTTDPLNNEYTIDGFHHITLAVGAGGEGKVHQKGGAAPPNAFTVQLSAAHGPRDSYGTRFSTLFGDAHLATPSAAGSAKLVFARPVVDKVSLAVSLAGASSAAVSAEVKCVLRPSAYVDWQNAVYDLLLDAWRAWDREWRMQEAQGLGPQLSAIDATSPARNVQVIAEELRRQVVTWLMDDRSFGGAPAMATQAEPGWQRYDIDAARATAPAIQFLEQALEWGNLSYVCYPYYWARGSEWDDLVAIEGADPNLVSFLRSGSARVVVPARPGFELAVLHWLLYQQPFLGDPLPLPDDELYVSIATEIRDLTRPPEDGEAGECWEARLPTTLMWLDEESRLPVNPARRLGKAPHAPKDPFCPETGGPPV
jgi:hypothetical protein